MNETKPEVLMYWRPGCGYCQMAKQLLTLKQQQFDFNITYVNIWEETHRRQEMMSRTQGTTVPQILINDQPIGGYTDLAALEDQGQLDHYLTSLQSD